LSKNKRNGNYTHDKEHEINHPHTFT